MFIYTYENLKAKDSHKGEKTYLKQGSCYKYPEKTIERIFERTGVTSSVLYVYILNTGFRFLPAAKETRNHDVIVKCLLLSQRALPV